MSQFNPNKRRPAEISPEYYLDQPINELPAIGDRRELLLNEIGIYSAEDLLYHFPRTYLDRSNITPIGKAVPGEVTTLVGSVTDAFEQLMRNRRIFKVILKDDTGYVTLNWFQGYQWLKKAFEKGDLVSVSGKIDFYNGLAMTHPDFDFLDEGKSPLNTGRIIPVYSLNQKMRQGNLNSRQFRRIYQAIFRRLPKNIPDPVPLTIREPHHLMGYFEALEQMHFPESEEKLIRARYRFKFQELLMLQTILAIKKKWLKGAPNAPKITEAGDVIHDLYHRLPYELTEAQKRVIREIYADLKKPEPMQRLLQGDVGSGKTVVAAIVASIMVASGYQVAIMAPTEILAEQHARSFEEMFKPLNVASTLLIGKQRKSERQYILQQVESGEIPIVIGTHALIQDNVSFSHLGLVIIDEQHRFGVDQRGALIRKGLSPHVLAMTATPIPRTLSITLYGDMDISVIDEMPKGRQKIITKSIIPQRLEKVYKFIRDEIIAGRQIYVVYPLISESQKLDLEAAEMGYEKLAKHIFPDLSVAMLHGRTSKDEKDLIMTGFLAGEIKILVSTTVIEVGVNVPNATVMIIENAERFGLTQLHQLRGRVGRGAVQSYCILVNRQPTEQGNTRLRLLERESNGFKISEEDLRLRGPGDYFSARQHGEANLLIADLIEDSRIIHEARLAAFKMINNDPQLLRNEHRNTRNFFLKHYQDKLDYATIG